MGMMSLPERRQQLNLLSSLKDHAAALVSDEAFAKRHERWPKETPDTKEAYLYREIFDGDHCLRVGACIRNADD
jgi:hypothetical protein